MCLLLDTTKAAKDLTIILLAGQISHKQNFEGMGHPQVSRRRLGLKTTSTSA